MFVAPVPKVEQEPSALCGYSIGAINFHVRRGHRISNLQSINEVALVYFKGPSKNLSFPL
jgi:hypothetical protein